jgi:hypothetical protein
MGARGRLEYLLLALAAEKVAQHAVVTQAVLVNASEIRDDVAGDWRLFAVAGAAIGAGFLLSLAGLWRRRVWAPAALFVLGGVDAVGEFVAQGTLAIHVTVSLFMALAIMFVAVRVQQARFHARDARTSEAR